MAGRLDDRLRDPLVWTGMLQLVKTVAAAVIAWLLATEVFSLSQSFLAPWAALLTVQATVYRTLTRGIQQAAAAVVGVLLAFAVTPMLGVSWGSLALVLLAALALGAIGPMREESTTAAVTALVVLLAGYSDDGSMLLERLADTFIGIAVGLAVNLVVWPPLRDRRAARRIDDLDDRLGALLADMASGLQSNAAPQPDRWVEHTRELDHGIDDAWADVRRARESGRLNLRGNAARRIQDTQDLGDLLVGLEQAVADTRSMARTIGRAGAVAEWEPRFRDAWVAILGRAADAVRDANVDDVRRVCEDLESLSRRLADTNADPAPGPVQGALVVNLRNILEEMTPVAAAQPVGVRSRDDLHESPGG